MSLPPVFYHYFPTPLPYARTLLLQERIHTLQLSFRHSNSAVQPDLLLLLQHRPVYTAGRRQLASDPYIQDERSRLTNIGADFVTTQRGGQLTYHGPGQIVGYPLIDLGRWAPAMGIRDYICRLQKTLQAHLTEAHGLSYLEGAENTGVFFDEKTKVASIGVQVRHRLTTHGFAMNITDEPLAWFDQIVACGLADVKAGSVTGTKGEEVGVQAEIPGLVSRFGKLFEREMVKLDLETGGLIAEEIRELEQEAEKAGSWETTPRHL